MKKTLKESIIRDVVDNYKSKEILINRLRNKSKSDVYYGISLNNRDVVHVYNSVYVEEFETILIREDTALCNSKITSEELL